MRSCSCGSRDTHKMYCLLKDSQLFHVLVISTVLTTNFAFVVCATEQALQLLQNTLKVKPNNVRTLHNLAQCYERFQVNFSWFSDLFVLIPPCS